MKRASYKEAISWIAEMDSPGEDGLNTESVSELITVCLIADIFDVSNDKVSKDVIKYRKKIMDMK